MTSEPLSPAIDSERPWPGLSSYAEDQERYFFGRDAETAALLRVVESGSITLFFGKSGLGKTSLLRAALFPRLREHDVLPVYVRIDYAAGVAVEQQLIAAITAAMDRAEIDGPRPPPGRTLWEHLHRSDVRLWSPSNRLVRLLVVLDQFEELFTLGRSSAPRDGEALLELLESFTENRPPPSLRDALELDPDRVAEIDFERRPLGILLTLREDFLPELDALRSRLGAIAHRRFRMEQLNGEQAWKCVVGPGRALVDDDTALRILEFVAGAPHGTATTKSLAPLRVEPALLSVACRELNERRIERGEQRITADVLSGSRDAVLSGFYERAIADLDPRVRVFVEDELVSPSGFRLRLPLEDVLRAPAITPLAIETLIARRLIRREEVGAQVWVELTHDVLTGVLRRSRDERQLRDVREKEARDAARVRAELTRARKIAITFGLLAVIAILVGTFAFWQRGEAVRSRGEAEKSRANLYLERGRQELLAGAPDRALVYLAAARQGGVDSPALGFLLHTARESAGAEIVRLRGHARDVTGTSFSPDGKWVATWGADHTLKLWSTEGGELVGSLDGHDDSVTSARFSGDGARIITGSADFTARIWDIGGLLSGTSTTGNAPNLVLRGHRGRINTVAFSADGKMAVTASSDETAIVWSSTSGKSLHELAGHKGEVLSAAISPDGASIVTASVDGTAWLWDVDAGTGKTLSKRPGPVFGARFLAKENGVLVFGAGGDLAIVSFDGKEIRKMSNDLGDIAAAIETRAGYFAAVSTNGRGCIFGHDLQRPCAKLEGHEGPIYGLVESADGRVVITAGEDRRIILWDATSGLRMATLQGHEGAVTAIATSTDGRMIASASRDRSAALWRMPDVLLARVLHGHSAPIASTALSPDGRLLATCGEDGKALVWDQEKLERPNPLFEISVGPTWCRRVAFDPTSSRLITVTASVATVWKIDGSNPEKIAEFRGHKDRINSIEPSADGTKILTGGADKTWRVFTASTGVEKLSATRRSGVLEAHWAAAGTRIVSLPENIRGVDVGSPETGSILCWTQDHPTVLTDVAVRPDSQRFATAALDGIVRVFRSSSCGIERALEGHSGPVRSVAFGPKRGQLISASDDRTARIWDVDGSGTSMTLLHPGRVTSAMFDAEGAMAWTVTEDGGVRLWDAASGWLLSDVGAHTELVPALLVDAVHQRFITAGWDGVVKIWRAPHERATSESDDLLLAKLPWRLDEGGALVRRKATADERKPPPFDEPAVQDALAKLRALASGDERERIAVEIAGLRSNYPSVRSFEVAWAIAAAPFQGLGHHLGGRVGEQRGAAVSGDGARLATVGDDGWLSLWDTRSGERVAHVVTNGSVRLPAFSAAGDKISTEGRAGEVVVLAARTGAVLRRWRAHEKTINRSCFTPDGARLVTTSQDGHATLWDASSGDRVRDFDHGGADAIGLAISPDGQRMATGDNRGVIRLWSLATGALQGTLDGSKGEVRWIRFSADGARLVSLSSGDGEPVRVWSPDPPKAVATLAGEGRWIHTFDVHPRLAQVITGHADGSVRLWDLGSGALIRRFDGPPDVVHVAFDAGGARFASSHYRDASVRVWSTASGKEVAAYFGHRRWEWYTAFFVGGDSIASSGDDGRAFVWSLRGATSARIDAKDPAIAASWMPGARTAMIATASTAIVWSPEKGDARQLPLSIKAISAASADSRIVALGTSTGALALWDITANSATIAQTPSGSRVERIAISAAGQLIALNEDGEIWTWWPERPRLVTGSRTRRATALAFAASGALLVGDERGAVRIFDPALRDPVTVLAAHASPVAKIGWSPDEASFATGGDDGVIKIWPKDGRRSTLLSGHSGRILDLRFAREASGQEVLISMADDKTVRRWRSTGELLGVIRGDHPWTQIDVDRTGSLLVTLRQDGQVQLWDLAAAAWIADHAIDRETQHVSFAEDGSAMLIVRRDGEVARWPLRAPPPSAGMLDELRRYGAGAGGAR